MSKKGFDLFEDLIKKQGICCICSKLMNESTFVSLAQLNKKATWKYPVWNNVLVEGLEDRAMAVVCDTCNNSMESGKDPGPIKYAVEVRGKRVILHKIEDLEDVPPLQEIIKPTDDPEKIPDGDPYLFHGSTIDSRYGPGSWKGN